MNPSAKRWIKRFLVAGAYAIILSFLLATPDSPLEKANWIAYAVCHRMPSHSLLLNEQAMPLCARCTGTFLGSVLALVAYALFRPKASELPPTRIVIVLFSFTVLWALDGLNSFVTDLTPWAGVYPPQNWLRLLTGTLNGLMMASMLYPVVMQTFWRQHHPQRALRNWRDLGLLVLLGLAAVGLVLLDWRPILYTAALISAAGVLVMLTLVHTIILLILTRRENLADNWYDMLLPLLGGLAMSVLLVGGIGLLRFALTGTMSSLPGLAL